MTVYWIMFAAPFIATLFLEHLPRVVFRVLWIGWGLALILIIGGRFTIGGDWNNYLEHFYRIESDGLSALFVSRSLGYGLVNWFVAKVGMGITAVNIVSATFFILGLCYFCQRRVLPWVAMAVAPPFMIIVVGLGFSRQAIALGFLLIALGALEKRKFFHFALLIGIGSLFHETLIMMIGLAGIVFWREIISYSRKNLTRLRGSGASQMLILIGIVGLIGIVMFWMVSVFDSFWKYYVVRDQWTSSGGLIRVIMNALPAVILLAAGRQWPVGSNEEKVIWRFLSYCAVLSVLFVVPFSTAIDRVGIYLLPLQVYVWGTIPALWRDSTIQVSIVVGILAVYALVLFVWLNFAEHSYSWVPYESVF